MHGTSHRTADSIFSCLSIYQVPAVASDSQQPTPDRDSPSGMVEATKVRAMMEKVRTQLVERNQLMEAIRVNSENTLTSLDQFLAEISEL